MLALAAAQPLLVAIATVLVILGLRVAFRISSGTATATCSTTLRRAVRGGWGCSDRGKLHEPEPTQQSRIRYHTQWLELWQGGYPEFHYRALRHSGKLVMVYLTRYRTSIHCVVAEFLNKPSVITGGEYGESVYDYSYVISGVLSPEYRRGRRVVQVQGWTNPMAVLIANSTHFKAEF